MARFAFSALFSAVSVAAAFDDQITRDAAHGGVNREFAHLMALEYGLPLIRETKKGSEPVNKAAALKLADDFRAPDGHKAYAVRGWRKQAHVGAALDALALALRLGADAEDPARVAGLVGQGLYLGDVAAWEAALKPAPKAKAAKAEGKQEEGKQEEGKQEGTPTPTTVEAAETPQGDADADSLTLTPDEVFEAAMSAIAADLLTPAQLGDLRAACSAALGLDYVPGAVVGAVADAPVPVASVASVAVPLPVIDADMVAAL